MIAGRALLSRFAPLLACLGLLAIWQAAALILQTDSFPTALEAIRAVPSILGDKESLINILASLRRMAIGFSVAVAVSIPLGLMMGRNRYVASFFNPLLMIDLSGAEGGADADHHALARRRRPSKRW